VMDEAEIGEQAMVAACAFVAAGVHVPPRSLAAGIPAKVMRELRDEEIAWKREGTATYQDLTLRCLQSLREVEPLIEREADRPRLQSGDFRSMIATKRG